MHVDEVKGASIASVDEVAEPSQSSLATTVGDSWSSELGLTRKRHHVLLVDLGSLLGRQIRLASVVGLVGGEELSDAAGADEVLDSADPGRVVETGVDAKGGDEGEGVVEVDAAPGGAGGAPIRAPADVFTADEELAVRGLGVVIVDETALVGGTGAAVCWGGAHGGH